MLSQNKVWWLSIAHDHMTFLDASYLLLYPLTSQQKSNMTKWLSGQKKEFLGFLIIIGCDNKSAEITLEDNIFSELVEHQVKSLRYFKMEDLEFLQDILILICPCHFQLVDACCNVSPLFHTEQCFLCILRERIQASCKHAFRIADSSLELLNLTPLKYSRKRVQNPGKSCSSWCQNLMQLSSALNNTTA